MNIQHRTSCYGPDLITALEMVPRRPDNFGRYEFADAEYTHVWRASLSDLLDAQEALDKLIVNAERRIEAEANRSLFVAGVS